jgi:hypothetical protein
VALNYEVHDINYQEAPNEYEVPGSWQRAEGTTWLMPANLDVNKPAVERWLALGDWRFYSAGRPVQGNWPDEFRCTASELLSFLEEKSMKALISSFLITSGWWL